MARTATTRNALLGLLALREEWSTWELNTQLRRNLRFFWPRAESRILAELRRLDVDGLVRSRQEATGRRPRTVYAITARGRRALKAWLATPPRATALESEPLLRVLLGDLGGVDAIAAALDRIERDAHDILDVGRTVATEYEAGLAPFQDQVHLREFVFDYLSTHALGMLAFVERTRGSLSTWSELSEDARAEAAVRRITQRAAVLPEPLASIQSTS